ncbi:penicillin-binding protein 2 [Mastigocoleus sp. MO_188.B34]|uniref:peptidoglycan D,D-transpeptidase FtsI family protein n=1 Tax=Mastigocoleus sp. MO_188.B34 TaxID=3036635 RepID=UPI00261C0E87|nr:penicillin-binding protein 2 [Mastigocoleus sp. MO_188.B34]MDJ0694826.1 penicillin-binding protein 2 [Mastigocoleus sp. MO_188.B34]
MRKFSRKTKLKNLKNSSLKNSGSKGSGLKGSDIRGSGLKNLGLKNLRNSQQQRFSQSRGRKNRTPKQHQKRGVRFRLFVVWSILIIAGSGLGIHLYSLQIIQGPKLTKEARSQQMFNMRPFIPRRKIIDRNRDVLAIDRPVYTLYVHPNQFNYTIEVVASNLAKILGKDATELEKRFRKHKSGILLSHALPEATADRLYALRFDGLDLRRKYSRYYPKEDLAADVVGYIDGDRRGQAGIERSQQKMLERPPRTVRLSRSGNGSLMPDYAPEGFLHFDDLQLQLTIDSRLQRSARSALTKTLKKWKAKRGAVIVMDAWDGSLLALVCSPTYNPNRYSKKDIPLFRNWAVADLYEPGSTFKPLNVAIALEAGVINPFDVFNDNGTIQVADRTIKNADNKGNGRVDIAKILQRSSNIGMVKIIQRMRRSNYYSWLEKIGLGERSKTDLPSEVNSRLKSEREFTIKPIEPATASFGQGFSLTPLQLVQMVGSLANQGKLVTPHVVKGLVDSKGKMHVKPNLNPPRQIFSPGTTQKVVEMMETVVSKGTGKPAKISGYRIAGKTGTAQKADPNGGYRDDAKITSFVSILPVNSPRYVVLAIVDEPKGENAYGSTVAAPIAKSVMEALIPLEGIAPEKSNE